MKQDRSGLGACRRRAAAGGVAASAHLNPAEHGSFMAGFSHPLSGLDHILVMVAVGLWAAMSAVARSGWCRPRSSGRWRSASASPCRASPAVRRARHSGLGGRARPPCCGGGAVAGVDRHGVVGAFALFHGHAHGSEVGAATMVDYGLGFAIATVLLHVVGIGLGLAIGSGRVLPSQRGTSLRARSAASRPARRRPCRRLALRLAMIPGEVIPADGPDIVLNEGAETVTLIGRQQRRPAGAGRLALSFLRDQPALCFDRDKARGMRLDIAAGTAVRFEPGQSREVTSSGHAPLARSTL